jgi:Zn-finger protein
MQMSREAWVVDEDMTNLYGVDRNGMKIGTYLKCPFYDYCQQLPEKIRDRYGIMGYFNDMHFWCCELCEWIDKPEVVEFVKDNKSKFPGQVFTEALRKFGG